MGYACPVCSHPQSDARHLANHLAFTALARGGDHEAWLDNHVPDWESMDESSLGDRVTDHAEETEFPQVFEDTTASGTPDAHDHADHADHAQHGGDPLLDDARSQAASGTFSDDAADVLERARELTRRRHENATDDESETE